mmetsp:Transcript_28269/g.64028  ORF Transcript_28269/g.64028 Transcript_28269/m.64028 type:complete len:141 (+) Transcript_28269:92-514(+)
MRCHVVLFVAFLNSVLAQGSDVHAEASLDAEEMVLLQTEVGLKDRRNTLLKAAALQEESSLALPQFKEVVGGVHGLMIKSPMDLFRDAFSQKVTPAPLASQPKEPLGASGPASFLQHLSTKPWEVRKLFTLLGDTLLGTA